MSSVRKNSIIIPVICEGQKANDCVALSGETNILSPAPAEIALGNCAANDRT